MKLSISFTQRIPQSCFSFDLHDNNNNNNYNINVARSISNLNSNPLSLTKRSFRFSCRSFAGESLLLFSRSQSPRDPLHNTGIATRRRRSWISTPINLKNASFPPCCFVSGCFDREQYPFSYPNQSDAVPTGHFYDVFYWCAEYSVQCVRRIKNPIKARHNNEIRVSEIVGQFLQLSRVQWHLKGVDKAILIPRLFSPLSSILTDWNLIGRDPWNAPNGDGIIWIIQVRRRGIELRGNRTGATVAGNPIPLDRSEGFGREGAGGGGSGWLNHLPDRFPGDQIDLSSMYGKLLEEVLEGQSWREARIGKLRRPVVVIDEIDPSGWCVAHLPSGGQGSGHGEIPQVPRDPRIVPCAHSARHVIEVDLKPEMPMKWGWLGTFARQSRFWRRIKDLFPPPVGMLWGSFRIPFLRHNGWDPINPRYDDETNGRGMIQSDSKRAGSQSGNDGMKVMKMTWPCCVCRISYPSGRSVAVGRSSCCGWATCCCLCCWRIDRRRKDPVGFDTVSVLLLVCTGVVACRLSRSLFQHSFSSFATFLKWHIWKDGCINGWIHGWMDTWMDGLPITMTSAAFARVDWTTSRLLDSWGGGGGGGGGGGIVLDRSRPLTTSRYRIDVIPTASRCPPFFPAFVNNNQGSDASFISFKSVSFCHQSSFCSIPTFPHAHPSCKQYRCLHLKKENDS